MVMDQGGNLLASSIKDTVCGRNESFVFRLNILQQLYRKFIVDIYKLNSNYPSLALVGSTPKVYSPSES